MNLGIQIEDEGQQITCYSIGLIDVGHNFRNIGFIFWNYLYLTNKQTEMPDEYQRQALLETVKGGSIITRKLINFYGEYDFSSEKLQNSVGLNLPPKWIERQDICEFLTNVNEVADSLTSRQAKAEC